jgi:hypothetical protein
MNPPQIYRHYGARTRLFAGLEYARCISSSGTAYPGIPVFHHAPIEQAVPWKSYCDQSII